MNRLLVLPVLRWLFISAFVVGATLRFAVFGWGENPEVLLPIAAYTVVGAVVTARRPENPIGWVFLGVGGLTGVGGLSEVLAYSGIGAANPHWWAVAGAGVTAWYWFPLLALMTTFTVLLYPSGLPSRRWRPVLWLAIVSTAMVVVLTAIRPYLCLATATDGCPIDRTVANPWSPAFMANVVDVENSPAFNAASIVILLCGFAAVVSAVVRTRRATGVERLQMRWFSFAVSTFVAELLLEPHLPFGEDSLVTALIFASALTFVPVSCGIAIMRYRLYEIDRIVSRTTSYALVTTLLVAVYVGSVTTVSRLLPDSNSNSLAVAAATLAAAALFRPLLARVQAVVDHRFNRSRYDAEHAVDEFARRLRDEVDPDAVNDYLLAVVQTSLEPNTVGLVMIGSDQ